MTITTDTDTKTQRLELTPAQFAKVLDVGLDALVNDGDIPARVVIPDNVGADSLYLDNDDPQYFGVLDKALIGINVTDQTVNI